LDSFKLKNKNQKLKTWHLKPLDFQIASSIWNPLKKMTGDQTMPLTQSFFNNWKKQDSNNGSFNKPIVIEDEVMSVMGLEEEATNLEVDQEEAMDITEDLFLDEANTEEGERMGISTTTTTAATTTTTTLKHNRR
jgi:hypothetical protein